MTIDPAVAIALAFVGAFIVALRVIVIHIHSFERMHKREGEMRIQQSREYHTHQERMRAAEQLAAADRVRLAEMYHIMPSEMARAVIDGEIVVPQLPSRRGR